MSETNTYSSMGSNDRTIDELKALLREAEAALGNAGDEVGKDVSALRERLRDALAVGKSAVGQAAQAARRQAARTDELVRGHPYSAIGLAVGAGLLAGLLASRCMEARD